MMPEESEFNQNVEQIQTDTDSMRDEINKCIDKYNNHDFGCWNDLINSGTQDKIREAINALQTKWTEFTTEMAKLASPGWPFWFLDRSDDWLEVKRKLTGQLAFLTGGAGISLPATITWDSPDARTYKTMPGAQADALSGMSSNAGSLADHLHAHGLGIVNLWFDLGDEFIDFAQLIAGSVARFISADPLKWLDIVPEIVAVVNDLVDFVQGLFKLIRDRWTDTIAAMHSLKSDFADMSGSVAGKWPTIPELSS